MKTLFTAAFVGLLLFGFQAESQVVDTYQNQEVQTSKVCLGLSTGINNFNGIAGANLEVNLANKISGMVGVGLGGWGTKASAGFRFYKHYPRGLIYSVSFSTHSGADKVTQSLETTTSGNGKQDVDIKFKRANTINLTLGSAIPVGRKSTRLFFEGGYAIPLESEPYEVLTPGVELTDESKAIMDVTTPGGLLLSIGLSFGL